MSKVIRFAVTASHGSYLNDNLTKVSAAAFAK